MALGFFDATSDPANPDSYEAIQRKRKLAEAMMAQGMDTSPVKHWTQGLARLANAGVGAWKDSKLDEQEKAAAAPVNKTIADAIMSMNGGGAPVSSAPTSPQPGGTAPSLGPISGDAPTPPASIPPGKNAFVASIMPHAMKVSEETGLDPRLVVAQAALESGWGKSAPGNNYFGIKSHGAPGGQTLATTEVVNGQPVRTSDSFRGYADMGDSAKGYADFLKANPRYQPMLQAQGLDAQIAALAKSGYATDPQYGAKVSAIARGLPTGLDAINGAAPQVASNAPGLGYAPQPPLRPGPIETSPLPPLGGSDAPLSNFQPIPGSAPVVPSEGFSGSSGSLPQTPQIIPAAPGVIGEPTGPVRLAGPMPTPDAQPTQQQQLATAMGGGQAPKPTQDYTKLLLAQAMNPALSPAQRQQAMQVATFMQGQNKATYQTDGDGNIIQLDPSGRTPPRVVYKSSVKPIAIGQDQRLIDPSTGRVVAGDGESKIARDSAERQVQAEKMGLDPKDSRTQQFILTGSYPKEPELTSTDKNAIIEADDLVAQNRALIGDLQKAKELSPKAYGDSIRNMYSGVGSVIGDETARNTVELNNLVTGNALSSLKTIFGGNPTEGERKILLDIQGAGSQPDAVRQKIFDRAQEAARRRLQFNEDRAKQLRGGSYYKPNTANAPIQPQSQQAPVADPLGIR